MRKITVPVGDAARAGRAARYPLRPDDAAEAFAPAGDRDALLRRPSPKWLGSPGALRSLGLHAGEAAVERELALALQGRHTGTREQVRRPGLTTLASRGGQPRWVVTSLDLTFSAPKSVSVLWSQADPELRLAVEQATVAAARAVLTYMTHTKPVVRAGRDEQRKRIYAPARGFAATAALHVVARRAAGDAVPWPQLHVHGVVVGGERDDGVFAGLESAGLFKRKAPLEGGAVGRLVLAERLAGLGLDVRTGTGRQGRFFEIEGIPQGVIYAMSGRAHDVEREVALIEATKGKTLRTRERAVVAMKTRAPKSNGLAASDIVSAWNAVATEHGFGPADAAALHRAGKRRPVLEARRADVKAAIDAWLQANAHDLTPADARVIAFERATGRLNLAETHELIEQMALPLDEQVTTRQLEALESELNGAGE